MRVITTTYTAEDDCGCSSVSTDAADGAECEQTGDDAFEPILENPADLDALDTQMLARVEASDWTPLGPRSEVREHHSVSYFSVSAHRSRYQLKTSVPSSCYLKVWIGWQLVSPPYPPPPHTRVTAYEHNFVGEPGERRCYKDSETEIYLSQFDDTPGSEYPDCGGEYPVVFLPSATEYWETGPVPEPNGPSEKLQIVKYSYVKGYEPDISDYSNQQRSGWPDPTWEAAAP